MLIKLSEIFDKWFEKLRDLKVKERIAKRLNRIEVTNNLGDYKSLGDSLYEIRIDYGAGYRLYFTFDGSDIIIILCAGDKSSQDKDIIKAKKLLTE